MAKVSTVVKTAATDFIGLDLSDKTATYVVVSAGGEAVQRGKLGLSPAGLERVLAARPAAQIAIEVGGPSPWVSRKLGQMGYTVTVANPRQVKLISHGERKNDLLDAENLARLLRYDRAMLRPISHRGAQAQADLALLRGRDALVRARTRLINSARSMVKAAGGRLPKCSADSFHTKAKDHLPALLRPALEPMLSAIAGLTEQITIAKRRLEKLADERYPETHVLRQVKGRRPAHQPGLCAYAGGAAALCQEPFGRRLLGTHVAAARLRRVSAPAAHHQGGRPLPAASACPIGPVHAGALRRGL
jgi:transposase